MDFTTAGHIFNYSEGVNDNRRKINLPTKMFLVLKKADRGTGNVHYVRNALEEIIVLVTDNFLASTGLFISPSGISELDCATTKTDTAERSISIGRESLQAFFVLGALAYFQVPPLGGSREEKWRSQ